MYNLYVYRYVISNRKKLLEAVFVAIFVAVISIISMTLLNYCQVKTEISSFNVQVRNTLKIINLNIR